MRITKVNSAPSEIKIDLEDKTAFVGSCFSENIATRMKESGLEVLSNPLGVFFNPVSITRLLKNPLSILEEESFLQKSNIHLNWYANSKVYSAKSKEDLLHKIETKLTEFHLFLQQSKFLFITLGSSYAYRLNENGNVVANCHKIPQKNFSKEMISLDRMVKEWVDCLDHLKSNYPQLNIVFTVSPVRHVKDGLIENTRSKARLFELVSHLENMQHVSYFPSYEIIMDECRDYAYFEADGVHPNTFAIDRVWSKFEQKYFDENVVVSIKKFLGFKQFFNHKALHPESNDGLILRDKQIEKWKAFVQAFPQFKDKLA